MTQKKKSFVLYNDMSSVFDLLSIEERGILITAIFEYVQYGDTIITAESDRATIAFQCIKNTLDRDRESYFAKCEAYSANGKKGGRPPKQWLSEKAKKADSDSVSDNDSVNVSDSDSDSVNVSDSDSDNIPRVSDACAPQLDEDDKKYLIEKGIPRGYIEERAERAEIYARDNGMDAQEVIRRWWQTDRATPPWNGERAYKMSNNMSNNTNGFSTRTPQEQAQKAREAEDWFEARLRKTFGDNA